MNSKTLVIGILFFIVFMSGCLRGEPEKKNIDAIGTLHCAKGTYFLSDGGENFLVVGVPPNDFLPERLCQDSNLKIRVYVKGKTWKENLCPGWDKSHCQTGGIQNLIDIDFVELIPNQEENRSYITLRNRSFKEGEVIVTTDRSRYALDENIMVMIENNVGEDVWIQKICSTPFILHRWNGSMRLWFDLHPTKDCGAATLRLEKGKTYSHTLENDNNFIGPGSYEISVHYSRENLSGRLIGDYAYSTAYSDIFTIEEVTLNEMHDIDAIGELQDCKGLSFKSDAGSWYTIIDKLDTDLRKELSCVPRRAYVRGRTWFKEVPAKGLPAISAKELADCPNLNCYPYNQTTTIRVLSVDLVKLLSEGEKALCKPDTVYSYNFDPGGNESRLAEVINEIGRIRCDCPEGTTEEVLYISGRCCWYKWYCRDKLPREEADKQIGIFLGGGASWEETREILKNQPRSSETTTIPLCEPDKILKYQPREPWVGNRSDILGDQCICPPETEEVKIHICGVTPCKTWYCEKDIPWAEMRDRLEFPLDPDTTTSLVFGNDSEIGKSCSEDSDCLLPGSYAVQSWCQFYMKCLKGNCQVMCGDRVVSSPSFS
ncbi:MAG: hypothetical protein ABH950_01130 [Candidatus Altiarchaeota archaeon]